MTTTIFTPATMQGSSERLRRGARKRLIRTAAMRRRDALALRIAAHHMLPQSARRFEGVRTSIDWASPLSPALVEATSGA